MGRALGLGFLAALRRWPVVIVLFVANLAAGFCFTAAAWSWLSVSLDNSLASRTLLTDLDWNVFVDLLVHHGQSLRMLLLGGLLLALPAGLLGIWLNATAVVAVGEDGTLGECMRRGLALYARFFQLSVLSNTLCAAGIAGGLSLGWRLARWTAESPSEITVYCAIGALSLVAGLLLLFLVTVHDHARVRTTASGVGALRAYLWAVRFVARREWRALPLAFLLLSLGFVLWVVYQTVGMLVATTTGRGVALSLMWGQSLLCARMLLRVWCFAAVTELQSLRR
ncbi:MAG TPA: hypothetical protein VMW56_11010 [Candidatus Margulisiibacteriota bacterium]|nr:hypothetical protein [Candidatus Margulisiibacteriota bacterium]